MENIWGPQRKTGNMEEESLREENRKAHEEDERFRMTAVKAAGQCVQRSRAAFVRRVEEYEVRKIRCGRIPGCEPSDAFEFGGPLSDDDVLCMGCAQRAKNDSKE